MPKLSAFVTTYNNAEWSSPRHSDTGLSDLPLFESCRTDLAQSAVAPDPVVVDLDVLEYFTAQD